jgi:hypothetical protein
MMNRRPFGAHALTSQLQYTVVFVVNPKTGEVEAYIPQGLNFGLRASPPNYCPKPELFVAVARRLLAFIGDHYTWTTMSVWNHHGLKAQ